MLRKALVMARRIAGIMMGVIASTIMWGCLRTETFSASET